MKYLVAVALMLFAHAALAYCSEHEMTDPDNVRLTGGAAMIITHASAHFDARLASKQGIDEATRFAKLNRIPVIYLQHESSERDYFMTDCQPDYWVYSEGGELGFDVQPSHVYVAGGHLEQCLSTTIHDVLYAWARQPKRDRSMTILMDAVYSTGDFIKDSDAYARAFFSYMREVTQDMSDEESGQKLTLLETTKVINDADHTYDYVVRVLRHYPKSLLKDYQVELQINDSAVEVLTHGKGWRPPVMRFHFVDGASKLTEKALLGRPPKS